MTFISIKKIIQSDYRAIEPNDLILHVLGDYSNSDKHSGNFMYIVIIKQLNDTIMLRWTVIFIVLAIIAGIFGFGGIAEGAASIAKVLFVIFLVLVVLSLLTGKKKLF